MYRGGCENKDVLIRVVSEKDIYGAMNNGMAKVSDYMYIYLKKTFVKMGYYDESLKIVVDWK